MIKFCPWNVAQAIELRQRINLATVALFCLLGLRFGVLSSRRAGSMMAVRGAHQLTVSCIALKDTKATHMVRRSMVTDLHDLCGLRAEYTTGDCQCAV
jgi:hypothetical protein